jgi:hypothetical protein
VNGIQTNALRPTKQRRNATMNGTVRIHDFGDEVHLRFKQRVPWPVALKILMALKAPGPAPDEDDLLRRLHARMPASKQRPVKRPNERQAA